jgi:hypothetical protein
MNENIIKDKNSLEQREELYSLKKWELFKLL